MIRRRTTLILAVFAALLAIAIRIGEWDDDSEKSRIMQARSAFRFDPSRATALSIRTDAYDILCERHGSQWIMQAPLQARADNAAIERLLGALSEVPRGEIVLPAHRAETDGYAPYGLDLPRARIWIADGARTNALLIGRRSPLGDGIYVRREGTEGIARTSGAILSRLPGTPADLRSRLLLSGAPGAVSRLEIRGPYGYIQLVRTEAGFWQMLQPIRARADAAVVARILETLYACSIVQFAQDNVTDFTPYGLRDESTLTAMINTDRAGANQILAFGEALPNASPLVYARLQAEASVYAVPGTARDALQLKPEALRARDLPPIPPESLLTIRIEEGGAAIILEKDPATGDWAITSPIRTKADLQTVENIASVWQAATITHFATNTEHLYPRTLTLRQNTPAGPITHTLHLSPDETDTHTLAWLEGETTPFQLAGRALLDLALDPLHYRTRDIIHIPPEDIAALSLSLTGSEAPPIRHPAEAATNDAATPPVWLRDLSILLAPLQAAQILQSDYTPPEKPRKGTLQLAIRHHGQTALHTTLMIEPRAKDGTATAYLIGSTLRFTLPPETTRILFAPLATPPPSATSPQDDSAPLG